jgi:hypothetical protein
MMKKTEDSWYRQNHETRVMVWLTAETRFCAIAREGAGAYVLFDRFYEVMPDSIMD